MRNPLDCSFPPYICTTKDVRGNKYDIESILIDPSTLRLEIRSCLSNEEWHAQFNAQYIEALTRKAGNFKQFNTFVHMLHLALTQKLPNLRFDVVSSDELNLLRRDKFGSAHPKPQKPDISSIGKLYLIFTYHSDFDNINYPLPLNYMGTFTAEHLRMLVRELRAQLVEVKFAKPDKEAHENPVCPTGDVGETNARINELIKENHQLTQQLAQLRTELSTKSQCAQFEAIIGPSGADSNRFRQIINGLENELFEEKSKVVMGEARYMKELNKLRDELNASDLCQRKLHTRIEGLEKELSSVRHNEPPNQRIGRTCSSVSDRRSRWDGTSDTLTRPWCTTRRVGSASPSLGRPTSNSREPWNMHPSKYSSVLRRSYRPTGSDSCINHSRVTSRSPSTAYARFNPTAYIRERELQLESIAAKRRDEIRTRLLSNSIHMSKPSRNRSESGGCSRSPTHTNFQFRRTRRPNSPAFYSSYESLPPDGEVNRMLHRSFRSSKGSLNQSNTHAAYLSSAEESDASRLVSSVKPNNGTNRRKNCGIQRKTTEDVNDSDYGRRCRSRNRHENKKKTLSPSNDIELKEIDRRLDVLQSYFDRYLNPDC